MRYGRLPCKAPLLPSYSRDIQELRLHTDLEEAKLELKSA